MSSGVLPLNKFKVLKTLDGPVASLLFIKESDSVRIIESLIVNSLPSVLRFLVLKFYVKGKRFDEWVKDFELTEIPFDKVSDEYERKNKDNLKSIPFPIKPPQFTRKVNERGFYFKNFDHATEFYKCISCNYLGLPVFYDKTCTKFIYNIQYDKLVFSSATISDAIKDILIGQDPTFSEEEVLNLTKIHLLQAQLNLAFLTDFLSLFSYLGNCEVKSTDRYNGRISFQNLYKGDTTEGFFETFKARKGPNKSRASKQDNIHDIFTKELSHHREAMKRLELSDLREFDDKFWESVVELLLKMKLMGTNDILENLDEDDYPVPEIDQQMNSGIEFPRMAYDKPFGDFDYSNHWNNDNSYKHFNELLLRQKMGLGSEYGLRPETVAWDLTQRLIPRSSPYTVIKLDSPAYHIGFIDDGSKFFCANKSFDFSLYDTADTDDPRFIKKVDLTEIGRWTLTDVAYNQANDLFAVSSLGTKIAVIRNLVSDPSNFEMRAIDLGESGIMTCDLSADGSKFISGTSDASSLFGDLETGLVSRRIRHGDDVNCVRFLPSNDLKYLTASDDGTARLFDGRLSTEAPVISMRGHKAGLVYVEPHQNEHHLITNSKDQTIKLWDMRYINSSPFSLRRVHNHDYRYEEYTDEVPGIPMYNDSSLKTYWGHHVHQTLIRCHFSPYETTGSQYIYSGSADGCIYVWSIDGSLVTVIKSDEGTRFEQSIIYNYSLPKLIRDVVWHPKEISLYSSLCNLSGDPSTPNEILCVPFNHKNFDGRGYIFDESDRECSMSFPITRNERAESFLASSRNAARLNRIRHSQTPDHVMRVFLSQATELTNLGAMQIVSQITAAQTGDDLASILGGPRGWSIYNLPHTHDDSENDEDYSLSNQQSDEDDENSDEDSDVVVSGIHRAGGDPTQRIFNILRNTTGEEGLAFSWTRLFHGLRGIVGDDDDESDESDEDVDYEPQRIPFGPGYYYSRNFGFGENHENVSGTDESESDRNASNLFNEYARASNALRGVGSGNNQSHDNDGISDEDIIIFDD